MKLDANQPITLDTIVVSNQFVTSMDSEPAAWSGPVRELLDLPSSQPTLEHAAMVILGEQQCVHASDACYRDHVEALLQYGGENQRLFSELPDALHGGIIRTLCSDSQVDFYSPQTPATIDGRGPWNVVGYGEPWNGWETPVFTRREFETFLRAEGAKFEWDPDGQCLKVCIWQDPHTDGQELQTSSAELEWMDFEVNSDGLIDMGQAGFCFTKVNLEESIHGAPVPLETKLLHGIFEPEQVAVIYDRLVERAPLEAVLLGVGGSLSEPNQVRTARAVQLLVETQRRDLYGTGGGLAPLGLTAVARSGGDLAIAIRSREFIQEFSAHWLDKQDVPNDTSVVTAKQRVEMLNELWQLNTALINARHASPVNMRQHNHRLVETFTTTVISHATLPNMRSWHLPAQPASLALAPVSYGPSL